MRIAFVLALLLAACTPGTGPDTPVTGEPGASQAPGTPTADGRLTIGADEVVGPAIPVSAALASAGEPVRVGGSLFIDAGGRVLLCEAIAESFPPQCGGQRVEVVGLEMGRVPELQEANGVRWAEAVELSGTVEAARGS